MSQLILGRYTRGGLWLLFLMCALPQHAWTLVLAFRDLSWLTERTNSWDAIGVLSYGLMFALVESLLLFLVFALLGLLVPRGWEPERRIALLGTFALILSLWAVLSQLFFLVNTRVPEPIIAFLVQSGRPLLLMYAIVGAIAGASFVLPAWPIVRGKNGLALVGTVLDRLGVLATLYLVFDLAALVIVVIRNL